MIRIAALNLTGGGSSGGYRTYLSAILPRLAASPEVEEILCASPASLGAEVWLRGTPKIKFVQCKPFRFMRHAPDAGLRSALDCFRPDVVFVTLERYLNYRNVPTVIVVHNMAPLSDIAVTEGIFDKVKCGAQYLETRIAVNNSSAVIVPTEYVKDILTGKWATIKGKIAAIKFGGSPLPSGPRPPSGIDVPDNFIFTAGSLEVYRGFEDLVQVLPGLKSMFPGMKLLVAGGTRPATEGYLRMLKKMAAGLGVAEDIVWLGNLPGDELSWCYRHCAAFVMTSRVESFGFVALEAMQHGCVCVSAHSSCLPEIFGDTARYYEVGDKTELLSTLGAALSMTTADKAAAGAAAIERAGNFSWDRAAGSTLSILQRAAVRPFRN